MLSTPEGEGTSAPILILLDTTMPGMHGTGKLRSIPQATATPRLKIILFTFAFRWCESVNWASTFDIDVVDFQKKRMPITTTSREHPDCAG